MSAVPDSLPRPAPAAGRLLVLAGPSGVGKGTVIQRARDLMPGLWVSVSVTTRAPRPGEVDGETYHFVDDGRFAELLAEGSLLEHDAHFSASYGTPRGPVEERLAAGRPAALEIDFRGARQVREALRDRAYLVFLAPPSWEELERRLRRRGTEDPAMLEQRLARAREEMAAEPEFDLTIVNEDVGSAAAALIGLWGSQT